MKEIADEGRLKWYNGILPGSRLAALGALLVRGLTGAAHSGGWDMPAALGSAAGAASAAILFFLGGAAICVLRDSGGKGMSIGADTVAFAAYALAQACREGAGASVLHICADGVLLLLAYLTVNDGKGRLALLLAFALRLAAPWLPFGTEAAGRLCAVCGSLAGAGMTGAALHELCSREERVQYLPILLGAAAAVLIRP